MPPPLADALADRLLKRLPADRAYNWASLKEESIPQVLAHFLRNLLRRRVEIEQEHLKVPRLPWLDYEHEEVRHAEEALLKAVYRHARIPALAWEEALRHAAEEVSAYLVRPSETLGRFAFGASAPGHSNGREDERPADMVLRRLEYFSAYPYLRKAARTYVEQRNLQTLSRARFAALLARVDEQVTAEHDTGDWLELLEPLCQLADTAYPSRAGVPVALLIDFFEQKKADVPLQRLRTARRERNVTTLSRDALREVLAPPAEVPVQEPTEEPDQVDEGQQAADDGKEAEVAPPVEEEAEDKSATEDDDAPVPLWKQFQPASSDSSPDETPDVSSPDAATPDAESSGAGGSGEAERATGNTPRPRWQQFQGGAPGGVRPAGEDEGAADARPLKAVEKDVLGYAAKSRDLFVRNLFDGSQEDYERVLRRLEAAETWQAATKVIARDVFRAHKVNIYSDPARSFTDAVEARYR